MQRRIKRWARRAVVVSCLLPAVVAAADRSEPAGADARSRLVRLHHAAMEQNYQGTMVFSAAGVVSKIGRAHV